MTEGERVFLIAAKELNFTRAAELAFVTPQCLSEHIKRLEKLYSVALFTRRPKLQLTQEGLVLQRWLQRIQSMEQGMRNELVDVNKGVRGSLRFGIPVTRGSIIIPQVLPVFQKRFPNVDVQIRLDDTRELEKLLSNGDLDIFLGVSARQDRRFARTHIASEPLYLVIPAQLLRQQFPDRYQEMAARFRREGIDLTLLKNIPLIQGHSTSTTSEAVQQFLLKEDIQVSMPINVSNFDILVDLCLAGDYATICAVSHLRRLMQPDRRRAQALKASVFPIHKCTAELDIDIITNRDLPQREYLMEFSLLLEEAARREDREVRSWLEQKLREP